MTGLFLKSVWPLQKNMGRYSGLSWSWMMSGGPLWLWVFVVGTPHVQQIRNLIYICDLSKHIKEPGGLYVPGYPRRNNIYSQPYMNTSRYKS